MDVLLFDLFFSFSPLIMAEHLGDRQQVMSVKASLYVAKNFFALSGKYVTFKFGNYSL